MYSMCSALPVGTILTSYPARSKVTASSGTFTDATLPLAHSSTRGRRSETMELEGGREVSDPSAVSESELAVAGGFAEFAEDEAEELEPRPPRPRSFCASAFAGPHAICTFVPPDAPFVVPTLLRCAKKPAFFSCSTRMTLSHATASLSVCPSTISSPLKPRPSATLIASISFLYCTPVLVWQKSQQPAGVVFDSAIVGGVLRVRRWCLRVGAVLPVVFACGAARADRLRIRAPFGENAAQTR